MTVIILGLTPSPGNHITGGVNPTHGFGNACNSVDDPDPSATIQLFLRNCPPGKFKIGITYSVDLTGTDGEAKGEVKSGYTVFWQDTGYTKKPVHKFGYASFTVDVGSNWTLAAQYTPTISLGGKAQQSTATAHGEIFFLGPLDE